MSSPYLALTELTYKGCETCIIVWSCRSKLKSSPAVWPRKGCRKTENRGSPAVALFSQTSLFTAISQMLCSAKGRSWQGGHTVGGWKALAAWFCEGGTEVRGDFPPLAALLL